MNTGMIKIYDFGDSDEALQRGKETENPLVAAICTTLEGGSCNCGGREKGMVLMVLLEN